MNNSKAKNIEKVAVNFIYTTLQSANIDNRISLESYDYSSPLTKNIMIKIIDEIINNGSFNQKSFLAYKNLLRKQKIKR